MNIVGILRQCLATGRATGRYPAVVEPPPPALRGMPELRPAQCLGTGSCAAVCPTGAIRVTHVPEGWTWRLDLANCTGCGLCVEACPETAIVVSPHYELAARNRADLVTELTFRKATASEAAC